MNDQIVAAVFCLTGDQKTTHGCFSASTVMQRQITAPEFSKPFHKMSVESFFQNQQRIEFAAVTEIDEILHQKSSPMATFQDCDLENIPRTIPDRADRD